MALPSKVSESVRRLNPHLFGTTAQVNGVIAHTVAAVAPRLRQHKGDGMNNWEREFSERLKSQWTHCYREVSLPIANGCRFKVDFLCVKVEVDELRIAGFEVKGRALAAGIAKLKVAATLYPWIRFVLATKRRKRDGGGWTEEIVAP